MAALIEVADWGVSFRDKRTEWKACIEKIGFRLEAGEALGVVGASGTGKSVTVQSLMGLYDARDTQIHEGAQVRMMGLEPVDHRGYKDYQNRVRQLLRGRIGIVFQEHRALMNPLKTVHQHFLDAARLAGAPRDPESIRSALLKAGCPVKDDAGLRRWLQKLPRQLSGGEAQRVQIAVSLISPRLELLVCDEVTSNLDTHNQWCIIRMLQNLYRERGIALLFISHDWEQIQYLCDHVLVLKKENGVGLGHTMLSKEESLGEEELADDPVVRELLPNRPELKRSDPVEGGRPVVEAISLCKSFHGREVLHQVDLRVDEGERYALIGESGSGKSTLARMILGIEKMHETSGDLKVFGQSKRTHDRFEPGVQMVFQNFAEAVNPYMTCGRHLENLLRVNPAADRELASEWLRDLEIEHAASRTAGQLSGGEKRRLGLVETFCLRPGLILADEPTAGLDKAKQAFFLKKLTAYRQEAAAPVTELLISHDLNLVGGFADRIGVLYAGYLVQEGSAADLLDPRAFWLHPYTELLLRARNLDLDDAVSDEPEPPGCNYYRQCHRKDRVSCAYKDTKPPKTETEDGWSLCPYPARDPVHGDPVHGDPVQECASVISEATK